MYKMNETYFKEQLENLMAIDSTTGYFRPIQDYVEKEMSDMGYEYVTTHKGGTYAVIDGEEDALLVTAHLDDIGLIVRHINANGTLEVTKVGGLYPYYAITENVNIYTRDGRVYTGTVQKTFSSVHVSEEDQKNQPLDYAKNVCVVLDEDVTCADDVRKLGIDTGAFIALDPRLRYSNGYIKSRFIDDKVCAAVLLAVMKEMKEKGLKPRRKLYAHFGAYEELNHGGSYIPADTKDILALDIACTGPRQNSHEKKVTIFAQDARFPYHYEMTGEIIEVAKEIGVDWVVDVFTPAYGTDADAAVVSGHDVRHAAIGQGTANSHGYERTHMDGVKNLYALLLAYMLK